MRLSLSSLELASLGFKVSVESMEDLFEMLDVDGGGSLTQAESLGAGARPFCPLFWHRKDPDPNLRMDDSRCSEQTVYI